MYELIYSSELKHHGIKGQKWGVENGPPYPLDYSKLSDEEKKLAKDSAVRRGDVKEANAYKNREEFTDQELQQLMNRFSTNQRLNELSAEKVKTTLDKVEDIADKIGRVSNVINKGSNFYNGAAKVSNAFFGTDLPIIGQEKKRGTHTTTYERDAKNNLVKSTTVDDDVNGRRITTIRDYSKNADTSAKDDKSKKNKK